MSGSRSIADQIPRETPIGVPEGSYFEVIFEDDSVRNESDTLWSHMSRNIMVEYFGGKKQVKVSQFHVKHILVRHDGIEIDMDIPEGCEVYQSFRSELAVQSEGKSRGQILGRVVGIVRDGKVIEERFLSELGQEVLGVRL